MLDKDSFTHQPFIRNRLGDIIRAPRQLQIHYLRCSLTGREPFTAVTSLNGNPVRAADTQWIATVFSGYARCR